jgi:hypothetical protein
MDGKEKLRRRLVFLESAATEELSRDEGGAGCRELFLSGTK